MLPETTWVKLLQNIKDKQNRDSLNKQLSSTGNNRKKQKREKHSKNMQLLQKNLENVIIGKNNTLSLAL